MQIEFSIYITKKLCACNKNSLVTLSRVLLHSRPVTRYCALHRVAGPRAQQGEASKNFLSNIFVLKLFLLKIVI